MDDFDYVL